MTTIFAVLSVAALSIPARKLPMHALVAFPPLAIMAGATAGPWIERLLRNARRRASVVYGFSAAAALGAAIATVMVARQLAKTSCAFSGSLKRSLSPAQPNEAVLLVSSPPNWRGIAELAGELRLAPNPLMELPVAGAIPDDARFAVVLDSMLPAITEPWTVSARSGGWVVLTR